ncbi:hypothetical protein SUNI508_00568 [Seiridium unicorne]|uniref:SigF-like NTF2-like domain-containing protein n=1 Tax=Seiridium unicorne TaxID=138068 RepID=A0ABR2V719_9PEZI
MDHPVHQIGGIVDSLCTRTIAEQQAALNDYFTPDAFFVHPLCRVPSFSGFEVLGTEINSLWLLKYVYQWYRILSPHIDLTVDSAVFDQRTSLLYLTMRQTFTLWFIPFSLWQAHVKLVTVLTLVNRPVDQDGHMLPNNSPIAPGDQTISTRWFIKGQEDHYQMEEWLKFIAPFGASLVWQSWQLFATALCWLGVVFLWPVTSVHDYLTHHASQWGKKAAKKH